MQKSLKVNHTRYVESISKFKGVTVGIGPAGTAKTYLACETCLKRVFAGEKKKLIITRPAITAEEDHGYLPGCINKKMAPYLLPIFDSFQKSSSSKELKRFNFMDHIEICPFAYMRGRTFDNAFIIADEMQNSTPGQMKMLLTRIGENSKLVIAGDVEQSDLTDDNGLFDIIKRNEKLFETSDESVIDIVKFTEEDVMRSAIVKEILDFYEQTS